MYGGRIGAAVAHMAAAGGANTAHHLKGPAPEMRWEHAACVLQLHGTQQSTPLYDAGRARQTLLASKDDVSWLLPWVA